MFNNLNVQNTNHLYHLCPTLSKVLVSTNPKAPLANIVFHLCEPPTHCVHCVGGGEGTAAGCCNKCCGAVCRTDPWRQAICWGKACDSLCGARLCGARLCVELPLFKWPVTHCMVLDCVVLDCV